VTVEVQRPDRVPAPGDTTNVTYEPGHPTNARWASYSGLDPDPDADPAMVRYAIIWAAAVTLLVALLSVPLLLTRGRPAVAAT
jgi:hypothetical protein